MRMASFRIELTCRGHQHWLILRRNRHNKMNLQSQGHRLSICKGTCRFDKTVKDQENTINSGYQNSVSRRPLALVQMNSAALPTTISTVIRGEIDFFPIVIAGRQVELVEQKLKSQNPCSRPSLIHGVGTYRDFQPEEIHNA